MLTLSEAVCFFQLGDSPKSEFCIANAKFICLYLINFKIAKAKTLSNCNLSRALKTHVFFDSLLWRPLRPSRKCKGSGKALAAACKQRTLTWSLRWVFRNEACWAWLGWVFAFSLGRILTTSRSPSYNFLTATIRVHSPNRIITRRVSFETQKEIASLSSASKMPKSNHFQDATRSKSAGFCAMNACLSVLIENALENSAASTQETCFNKKC